MTEQARAQPKPVEREISERLERIEAAIDRTRIPAELAEHLRQYGVSYTRTYLEPTGTFGLEVTAGRERGVVVLEIQDHRNGGRAIWRVELRP